MTAHNSTLPDRAARITAMTEHHRSLLVEAGAGSGKTAIMAGRVVMILLSGVHPSRIAAITFTELAASELLSRIREFVDRLLAGDIPAEVSLVIHGSLGPDQQDTLRQAAAAMDEISCSTIHGFCQRLIKPYPAEADIDPGASVADANEADLMFAELRDDWLRRQLSDGGCDFLAELVLHDPKDTVDLVTRLSDCMRRDRTATARQGVDLVPIAQDLRRRISDFDAAFRQYPPEPETLEVVRRLGELATALGCVDAETDVVVAKAATTRPHRSLLTKDGTFYAWRKKGLWQAVPGLGNTAGERVSEEMKVHYEGVRDAFQKLAGAAATRLIRCLVGEIRPLLDLYAKHKRDAALLDFDDLVHGALTLLRGHADVREALAARYDRVLVDEFQDTDPAQCEILWRLCGEPPAGNPAAPWTEWTLRPGALFAVGDPKQAIYRFRGADVAAYIRAREAIRAQDPAAVLSIATNFRSCKSILRHVNGWFEPLLSEENGQPGFTRLDHVHEDQGPHHCVAALDVDTSNAADIKDVRKAEAAAVAELCRKLIGDHPVFNRRKGEFEPCRAGDIALLAPTSTDLWCFEQALEDAGIPVSTQAGKGLFWRQEVQDLIGVVRVVSDPRDTLALGAVLRGPLVGLTEEELLDITLALPRDAKTGKPGSLTVFTKDEDLVHPIAKAALSRLRYLAKQSWFSTPHALLSAAVDELNVRAILRARHDGSAERSLANLDLFLDMSRAYATRGLRAFAEAMTQAWEDDERAGEGRPDAQDDAVSLYTMHVSKGLEWPVVIPVNTYGDVYNPPKPLVDQVSRAILCKVFGVAPDGHDTAAQTEQAEVDRERVRLWYVAATRAREMLVIPRCPEKGKKSWIEVAKTDLVSLPAVDVSHCSDELPAPAGEETNTQDPDTFVRQAEAVGDATRSARWKTPSRHDGEAAVLAAEEPEITAAEDDDVGDTAINARVQGGRVRGLVMHKLFEEVLTGESSDAASVLEARARELLAELGTDPPDDAAEGFSPVEMAKCVRASLALPEIAALRDRLVPECHVYSFESEGQADTVTFGIADAVAIGAGGTAEMVVDWKSDVSPDAATVAEYRAQVANYLKAVGVTKGLVVFATTGQVISVAV